MFLKWFEDDKLKQYLNYCFAPNNKDANVAYGQAVAMCIGETASVLECEGHYQKILQGEDYQHFLYKALGINAPSLDIADVGKKIDGVKASVISAGTTWKDLSSIVGQYLEGTSAQFKVNFDQTIALLLTRLQSSILKLGRPGSSSDAHIAKMALFIGRYADRPMVIIEASGTRKQITQALLDHGFAVQKEVAQGGKQGGGKGGQKAVRLNFDRLVREGAVVQAGSTQTFKMAAMVNQAALPSRVPVTHVLKAYQPITPGEVERQIKLQTRWGVLGVIVQGWALMQMIKNGAIEPKKLLTDPRLYAMIAGPIGAIMEIMDVKVKARGAYKLLPNGKGLAPNLAFNSSLRTRWFIGGKLLGAVAGGVMAVMDINDSIKEYNKGNKILTTLLAVSGVVGFSILFFSMSLAFELVSAAEIVLLFSRILLGLFVLTLILGAVISYFKEKKLYDWLKQTAWGVEPKFTAIASAKYALDDALGNS